MKNIVSQFLQYESSVKRHVPGTIKRRRIILNDFCRYLAYNNIDFLVVHTRDIIWYLQAVANKPIARSSRYYHDNPHGHTSAGTVNSHCATLKAFYSYCSLMGHDHQVDVRALPTIKVNEAKIEYLTSWQIRALMDVSASIERRDAVVARNQLMIMMMFVTGCRASELLSIRLCDITGDQIHIKGKWSKYRTVFINQEITVLMQKYLQLRTQPYINSLWLLIPDVEHDSEYLFIALDTMRYGKPLSYEYMRKIFKKYSKHVDFVVTPHVLRHSFAIAMLKWWIRERYIQKLMWHAHITTTENYLKVVDNDLSQAHAQVFK